MVCGRFGNANPGEMSEAPVVQHGLARVVAVGERLQVGVVVGAAQPARHDVVDVGGELPAAAGAVRLQRQVLGAQPSPRRVVSPGRGAAATPVPGALAAPTAGVGAEHPAVEAGTQAHAERLRGDRSASSTARDTGTPASVR